MAKRLKSAFTDDMEHCIYTGSTCVERHHIFGGPNRKRSEKYMFVVPLRPDIHPNGVYFNPPPGFEDIDIRLKRMAQDYFEEHHGTREEFRSIFGKSWL